MCYSHVHRPPNTMPSSLSSFLNAHERAVTNYQLIQKPLIISKSFPKIFSPQLTSTGLLSANGSKADVRSSPMGTTLQSSSSIHHCLTSLLTVVKSINIKRLALDPFMIWYHCGLVGIRCSPVVWNTMGGLNYSNRCMT